MVFRNESCTNRAEIGEVVTNFEAAVGTSNQAVSAWLGNRAVGVDFRGVYLSIFGRWLVIEEIFQVPCLCASIAYSSGGPIECVHRMIVGVETGRFAPAYVANDSRVVVIQFFILEMGKDGLVVG